VILGYIPSDYFWGGKLSLDIDLAKSSLRKIAETMNMTIEEAAAGIIDIVNANMSSAIRLATIEKGYDPADFTAYIYGGLGPGHGAVIVEKWAPGKAPFQVIWEAMDSGYLGVDNLVPQGLMSYTPGTDDRLLLSQQE
jgi:N-methylhydantoinase A/oxoprolinase/acetone carboxylase beta subunit